MLILWKIKTFFSKRTQHKGIIYLKYYYRFSDLPVKKSRFILCIMFDENLCDNSEGFSQLYSFATFALLAEIAMRQFT